MLVSPTINFVHGRIRSIAGTDPAAGAEILETVPDRRRWLLKGLNFTLTTDSTVADRAIKFTIDDGSATIFVRQAIKTQAADLICIYMLFPFFSPELVTGNYIYLPIPALTLAAGYRIRTTTTNLQAGDNYGAPRLLVEEWIDP